MINNCVLDDGQWRRYKHNGEIGSDAKADVIAWLGLRDHAGTPLARVVKNAILAWHDELHLDNDYASQMAWIQAADLVLDRDRLDDATAGNCGQRARL